jgi:hypothetical protein
VNCSAADPCALVPLQPVQLVSIEGVPGAIEKVGLVETALTPPVAQPASTSSAGPSNKAGIRVSNFVEEADRPRIG